MSKRGPSASASPSKNKRSKTQHTQFHIDHFFSSSALKAKIEELNHSHLIQGTSPGRSVQKDVNGPEVIDVDAIDSVGVAPAEPSNGPELESTPTAGPSGIVVQKMSENKPTSPLVFGPLDVDPIAYEPQLQPTMSKAPFGLLTHAFVALSQTRSRIAILNILTNVLRTIIHKYPSSLLPSVYLLSNSLKPQFIPVELGLGSSVISRAIQQISGLSSTALRKLYNSTGDPGDVAFAAKSNLRTLIPHPPLTIPYVYESLLKIAGCKGQGAAKDKQKIVEKLLLAASGEEVRYLTRTLCQNLRVGAVRTSILTALARAIVLTPPEGVTNQIFNCDKQSPHVNTTPTKSSISKGKRREVEQDNLVAVFKQAESLMKQVYARHPNFDQIIAALLEKGLDSLAERVPLTVGTPVLPMLGSPTRSLDEIYRRLGDLPFTAEFKYDGQRAQIHASSNHNGDCQIKVFSRHLEDMTSKYPDIIALVKAIMKDFGITSFIMDAEIVAIDPTSGGLKTFQELSNRSRKDVNLKDIRVSVCVFAFDLMFINEESLLNRPFRDRRSLLRQRFSPMHPAPDSLMAHFDFVKSCESEEGRTSIEDFMVEAIENRCEGLMVKLLDATHTEEGSPTKSRLKSLPSTYEPDLRTSAWLKLKKDYMEGIGDSLDLIPIGAWHGNGRKAEWWSPVLLALWNPDIGQPVAVCKCMSGFTDAFYKTMRKRYDLDSEETSKQPLWSCDFGGYSPDVYFRPHEVWEIRGADITVSPVSTAARGLVSSSRGLSLRFPRFIKTRDDKNIEQASTPGFLADIYNRQQGKGQIGVDEDDLIDVDVHSVEDGFSDEEEDGTL